MYRITDPATGEPDWVCSRDFTKIAPMSVPAKFRKKPVIIEAAQWLPNDFDRSQRLLNWLASNGCSYRTDGPELLIQTLEDGSTGQAQHAASPSDWVIRGVLGEFYACKPEIFTKTYEPA